MLIPLPDRRLIHVAGEDRWAFLQGLITQDVYRLQNSESQQALYSGALNAQGRLLYDMLLISWDEALWLDVDEAHAQDFYAHLKRYLLRQKVQLTLIEPTQWAVVALSLESQPGAAAFPGLMYRDPREPNLGWRGIMPDPLEVQDPSSLATYRNHQRSLGIPTPQDWESGKAIPLEVGLGDLDAISWTKGCYIGQELTTRTYHQGLVRKRLFPVTFEGPTPIFGVSLHTDDGQEVGLMRSADASSQKGMALLRIQAVYHCLHEKRPLLCGETKVTPHIPSWMTLPPLSALETPH